MNNTILVVDRNDKSESADLVVTNATVKRVINGEYSLQFETFKQELKSEYLKGNCVITDNNTFDVKYIQKNHSSGKITFKVEALHVLYRLKHSDYNYELGFSHLGTPKQILSKLLEGTDFTAGTVEFTESMLFSVQEATNKINAIVGLVNTLGGELDFSDNGFTINILNTIGQDNGFEIALGKNLKGITEHYDERGDEPSTSYEVNLIELKNSTQYEVNGFADLEVIGLGDTIRIVDEEMDIDITQRIISKTYNPIYAKNTTLEIAHTLETLTDDITDIKLSSVNKDTNYYGIVISEEIGVKIERYDKLAKALFNADTFKMQKGDGTGAYVDSLYFDPIAQVYKFSGTLEATFFKSGSIAIGENFSVDEDGNMVAKDGLFYGTLKSTKYESGSIGIGENFSVDILGNMKAKNGEFSGILKTTKFESGSIGIGENFSVDEDGNMKAKNGEFTGNIKGGHIEGVTIDTDKNITVGQRVYLTAEVGNPGISFGAYATIEYDSIGGALDINTPKLFLNGKRVLTTDDLK